MIICLVSQPTPTPPQSAMVTIISPRFSRVRHTKSSCGDNERMLLIAAILMTYLCVNIWILLAPEAAGKGRGLPDGQTGSVYPVSYTNTIF